MFGRQSLFVQTVARFMENAKERLRKILFIVASGQTAVRRAEGRAKWMRGGVNAPGFEVETDGGGHFAVERLLGGLGIASLQQILWNGRRALERGAEDRSDRWTKFGKQVAKLAGADPRFVFIRQCIVARFLVSPMIGHLPIEAEQFLEVRFEQGEFRALAGFTPAFSRVRAFALKFFH